MSEVFNPAEHYFLEYIDPKTGEMREDAPEQAKKDFRKWQREPDPEEKELKKLLKEQRKKK